MNTVVYNYFSENITTWRHARRDFVDPLQKSLEDIICMINHKGYLSDVHHIFEESLNDGYLIISEYAKNAHTTIYKLSDLGIEYMKLKML